MSEFEIFIVVLILLSTGLTAIAVCFSALMKINENERAKANLDRCKNCIFCKMNNDNFGVVFCEKVDKGAFIEPLDNCKYYRTSDEKSIDEIIDLYDELFDDFDNEV